jgi:hypothetical protein
MARRYSGLQCDVFKLYRELLRAARRKDDSGGLGILVSEQFRQKALSIERNEFRLIEHTMRWGYKQKKLMEHSGFSAAGVVSARR